MYRQYKPPKGSSVNIASLLPWWAFLLLALISWTILHLIAGIQVEVQPGAEGLFQFTGKQLWITLAMFGQILLPSLFIFAAIKSATQKIQSPLIEAAVLFLIAAILLCFLFANRKVEEKWPVEELYGMDWEPFTFDIWESGIDVDEIISIAKNQNIPLGRKTVINFNKDFIEGYITPYKDQETVYNYQTELLGSKAKVFLFLTEEDKKLMKLSIRWEQGEELFDPVKSLILKKLPTAEKTYKSMMTTKNVYRIDRHLEIEHEITAGKRLTITYKDMYLIQSDENYQRETRERKKREGYKQDTGKF